MKLGLLQQYDEDSRWLSQALPAPFTLCWQAHQRAAAARQLKQQPVDLLLLELYAGWQPHWLTELQQQTPCPVLLYSRGEQEHTGEVFAALGAGALDYVVLADKSAAATALLLKRIRQQAVLLSHHTEQARPRPVIVAIGASTGGPASLNELLKDLPPHFAGAVVIVQHLDGRFTAGMAEWLSQTSPLPVQLIRHQQQIRPGTIYLAGEDAHLHIDAQGRLLYSPQPEQALFRPSIDVFFSSLAAHWSGPAIGVLLTGMGQDGAQGLKKMRDKGWITIAQDQASSVVYGMPKAAVHLQAATEVLALGQIAPRLAKLCPG